MVMSPLMTMLIQIRSFESFDDLPLKPELLRGISAYG